MLRLNQLCVLALLLLSRLIWNAQCVHINYSLNSIRSSLSELKAKIRRNEVYASQTKHSRNTVIDTLSEKKIEDYSEEAHRNLIQRIFTRLDEKNVHVLTFYGLMFAGAIARSVAALAVHPLNVIKTMLQKKNGKIPDFKWKVLSRGAGSQFLMNIPHGAFNFVVTETTKAEMTKILKNSPLSKHISKAFLNSLLDFVSSSISTFICSIISTPQMVICDRIMAGTYDSFFEAVFAIFKNEGIGGFYVGWLPAVAQKIPSYSLTWMFFQQIKIVFAKIFERAGTSLENTLLGSLAAAAACCIMMPMDTVKTRIVTQGKDIVYRSTWHCFRKIAREEGLLSFYKALPPRLLSVVPMIGIQFSVYELTKRLLLKHPPPILKKMAELKKKQTIQ